MLQVNGAGQDLQNNEDLQDKDLQDRKNFRTQASGQSFRKTNFRMKLQDKASQHRFGAKLQDKGFRTKL